MRAIRFGIISLIRVSRNNISPSNYTVRLGRGAGAAMTDTKKLVEKLEREIVALRSAVDDAYQRGLAERKGVDPPGTEAICPKCRGPIEVHRQK